MPKLVLDEHVEGSSFLQDFFGKCRDMHHLNVKRKAENFFDEVLWRILDKTFIATENAALLLD